MDWLSEFQLGGVTNLSPRSGITKGIESPVPPVDRYNLFKHEREKESTTRAENSIVELEQESELLGLTRFHDFADCEDGGEVTTKNAENDWLGRKGSGSTNIMGIVVRYMRDGDIFKNEICEGSHGEVGDEKHGGVTHTQQRPRLTHMPGHKRNFKFVR